MDNERVPIITHGTIYDGGKRVWPPAEAKQDNDAFARLLREAVEAEMAWEEAVARHVDAEQAAYDAALAKGMNREAFNEAMDTEKTRRWDESRAARAEAGDG